MAVGKTTIEMSSLIAGDELPDLCGPPGNATHIERVGKVVLVGGGFGVAPPCIPLPAPVDPSKL